MTTSPLYEYPQVKIPQIASSQTLTVLVASITGNGLKVSEIVREIGKNIGLKIRIQNMNTFHVSKLSAIDNLLLIVSTHGNGAPALPAKELYTLLKGTKEPFLQKLNFAVLALGDSSYPDFCKAGFDFDHELERLGAKRIRNLHAGDIDVEKTAPFWIIETLSRFNGVYSEETASGYLFLKNNEQQKMVKSLIFNQFNKIKKPNQSNVPVSKIPSKSDPNLSKILAKKALYGKQTQRQVLHLILDIKASGIHYLPGDAVGILPQNSPELVEEVLNATGLIGSELVDFKGLSRSLQDVLINEVELSKITTDVLKRYKAINQTAEFQNLVSDKLRMDNYLPGRDIADLFWDYPVTSFSPTELISILRPLQPRLYSIASSPLEYPDEIHLTIGVVKYEHIGRSRKGTCSSYMSEGRVENEQVPIYIETNPNFRLPSDSTTPVILIGAGTGIAPYRAFMQHRSHASTPGKSWLFFGNRYAESEFLYESEWKQFLKNGILTRMDTAFSRDGNEKKYVQHRMLENATELFQWMQEGAHIYVCGNRTGMAEDVQKTLIQIVSEQLPCSQEKAEAFLDEMQRKGRYQLDVY